MDATPPPKRSDHPSSIDTSAGSLPSTPTQLARSKSLPNGVGWRRQLKTTGLAGGTRTSDQQDGTPASDVSMLDADTTLSAVSTPSHGSPPALTRSRTTSFEPASPDQDVAILGRHASPALVRRFTTSTLASRVGEKSQQEAGKLRQTTMEEVEVAARRRRQSRDLQGGHLDPAAENRTPEAAMRTRKESPPEMSLNSLPRNPKTWTPSQLAVYLAHVLKLIPAPLIADIHSYVLSERLGGQQFLGLRYDDLLALGINRRWARVMSEARAGLRRQCILGRAFAFDFEDDSFEGEDGATLKGILAAKGSVRDRNPAWKASWRQVSGKFSKGKVKGMAKLFEDDSDDVRNSTQASPGRILDDSLDGDDSAAPASPLLLRSGLRYRSPSLDSVASFAASESESVWSTDEIDLADVTFVEPEVATDIGPVKPRDGHEKTVEELLGDQSFSAPELTPSAGYQGSTNRHVRSGVDPYANVTRRSPLSSPPTSSPPQSPLVTVTQPVIAVDFPDEEASDIGADDMLYSPPFAEPKEGGTMKPSRSKTGSVRLLSPPSVDTDATQSLDQLFDRAGDLLGIVGKVSRPTSGPGSVDGQSRSGSVAIVRKSKLRDMEGRMNEIEQRLRKLGRGDLVSLDGLDHAAGSGADMNRKRRASNASASTSSMTEWSNGNVKWTDLGNYVVLASVGVGIAVGQVVLSKVFGVRH